MTISGYSSAIVDTMLGWLKGFANWVLRLFNLAGSSGASPLLWLSQNWLRLLILLMIVGVAADILIWLVRWRPHWVWFRKLRVIVDDERFFNESDIGEKLNPDGDDLLEKNWEERDYVVASTIVPNVNRRGRPTERSGDKRRGSKRRDGGDAVRRGERRRKPKPEAGKAKPAREEARRGESEKDFFGMDGARPSVTDYYEDEVFNVNNLPSAAEDPAGDAERS